MSAPSHRCHTCKSTNVNARNLVVFVDGTSHKPGTTAESNIVKLHELASSINNPEPGLDLWQDTLYLTGFGASVVDHLSLLGRVRNRIYSTLEMTFAWNAEENVRTAYSWLATKYRKGDQLYLFGFSRGAYQVRALASMIHEIGLVKDASRDRTEQAYRRYLSIDTINPRTKEAAAEFKKAFCWPCVRIHFVGVWETMSSLSLTQRDTHITDLDSVTNACHFRHALALDERRVVFMPEYFSGMNVRHSSVESPRPAISDVREVWFAGCHFDVGGIELPYTEELLGPVTNGRNLVIAGNASLVWMKQEAAANGLVFTSDTSEGTTWCPEDVGSGGGDTMNFWSKVFEFLPTRFQVAFSGTGKYKRRWHLARPRVVIPHQHIHFSALPNDVYTPQATLPHGIDIARVHSSAPAALWSTERPNVPAATALLTSLLSDQQRTLSSLRQVLYVLNSELENGKTGNIPSPQWPETSMREQSDFDKFALTVIFDVTSNFSTSQELLNDAKVSLGTVLCSPDHVNFSSALYVLRFLARHPQLRQHFIDHDEINALMLALDSEIAGGCGRNLFAMVMDTLSYLIDDEKRRESVMHLLSVEPDENKAAETRLLLALNVKAPNHLIAALRMIKSLARYKPDYCEVLKPRIVQLAGVKGCVGVAAVEALVALKAPFLHQIHFTNILGCLENILPRLDVEIGSTSSLSEIESLPSVLQVNGELNEEVMHKLVSTVESHNARQRTVATLTVLKLYNSPDVRSFCSRSRVSDIFMKQLSRKRTSLLAAYALNTCLKLNMSEDYDFGRAAQLIHTMLDKGWFDDAIGRVEGSEVFRELMQSDGLRKHVIESGIIFTIEKKLANGGQDETRMGLICFDIICRGDELEHIVLRSVSLLMHKKIRNKKKGVRILSSLALTEAGESAIMPHLSDIVKMLLPSSGSPPPSPSQLFGPTAVLHNLCKNEVLRRQILQSPEFVMLKDLRQDSSIYPQTR